MKPDLRSRVILPIVLPVLVLVVILSFVGAVAAVLLFNTKLGALALAAVAAAGILFTVSLASTHDKLDAPRRTAVVFAAALPLLVGGALAAGVIPGIDDDDRMINVEPLVSIPEDAPLIAAQNSESFCRYDDTGECVDTDSWEVSPEPDEDLLSYVFDNTQAGVPHNVVVTTLEGSPADPGRGEEEFASSTVITGPDIEYYLSEDDVSWEDLPDEWYFYCAVHPNMNGVGTVAGNA